MILYSIIPVNVVFGNPDGQKEAAYFEAEYLGETVVVSIIENNDYVISRLISTNPKSYLNQKLQPGTVIKNHELTIKSPGASISARF